MMSDNARRLAILGGVPYFDRQLHVGAPNIGDRAALMARLNDVLDRRWLTNNGRYVQEFEARLKDLTRAEHCIAVCNATVGLELAILALGLTGEVIVPSFTFVASAHALQLCGVRPVFCDIDPATHLLNPDQVEKLITPATTGILGVHLWGRACYPDRLAAVAERHGLTLFFDAAHALGCSSGDRMIGNFGRAEIFSFHATKVVNSLEGGAITTNDGALAARLRKMINFGFSGVDSVDCLGTNGKMNEFSAAMGITNLENIGSIVTHNRNNYNEYMRTLSKINGIRVAEYCDSNRHNFHYIVAEIDAVAAGVSRDDVVAALWAENVLARRYFFPGCHRMEPYRSLYPDAAEALPMTEAVAERVLLLPNGTNMSLDDVRACCQLIGDIVEHGSDVCHAVRSLPQRRAP